MLFQKVSKSCPFYFESVFVTLSPNFIIIQRTVPDNYYSLTGNVQA